MHARLVDSGLAIVTARLDEIDADLWTSSALHDPWKALLLRMGARLNAKARALPVLQPGGQTEIESWRDELTSSGESPSWPVTTSHSVRPREEMFEGPYAFYASTYDWLTRQ